MLLSEVHTTRLFPVGRGVDAYLMSGIAARCDWVVLSDKTAPHTRLIKQAGQAAPRHVFLSLREPFKALAFFAEEVLPQLNSDFILISGSGDATVPRQTDKRWRAFDAREQAWIAQIVGHPNLKKWFVENLDLAGDPRMAPFPSGWVFPNGPPAADVRIGAAPPLAGRELRVLCAHRVRSGPQWEPRRQVSEYASGPWKDFCTVVENEISEPEFFDLVQKHAFVLCVEGGGLDPAVKAWHVVLHGAVPIIRSSPLDAAYRQFPSAFVSDWTPDAITPARLARWRDQFAPLHDEPTARAEVLRRLGLDYWWAQVVAGKLAES